MEFFNTLLEYAGMGVTALGGGIAIGGLINFGEGKSQHNAGKQDEGMSKIVGGGFIMAIGLLLVPQMASLFNM